MPSQRGEVPIASAGADGAPRGDEWKLEVLDAASRPESPVSPNRTAIGLSGGFAGLAAGLLLARRRRGYAAA